MALIDTNKKINKITINGCSSYVLEDPRIKKLREYYEAGLISFKEFEKFYNSLPFTIVVESKKDLIKDEFITSRFEILDIR